MTKTFWDEKFSGEEYLYSKEPNGFYKKQLDALKPGSILLPGDGEGRNAVYAAKTGWDAFAFDASTRGKEKALSLAKNNNVNIDYTISDYQSFESDQLFDVVALIFSHLPSSDRQKVHRKYVRMLKPGGSIILQTFNKEQLGLKTGGPKDLDMLFSVEELKEDFQELSSISGENVFKELDEGPLHKGYAQLIELTGTK